MKRRHVPNHAIDTRTFRFDAPAAGGEFVPPGNYQATQEIMQEGGEDRAVVVQMALANQAGEYFRMPPSLAVPIPYALLAYEDQHIGSIIPTGPGGPGQGIARAQILVPDVPYYGVVPAERRLFANVRGPALAPNISVIWISISTFPADLLGAVMETRGDSRAFR